MSTPPTVMTVYGTRPEAIKVAPVLNVFDNNHRLNSVIVSSGQHRQMLDQVNDIFGIRPAFDLNIMRENQSLNGVVSRTISRLNDVISEVNPDAVMVHGDTSTAMAAALAGFHAGAKIVHLEAGLRSGNLHSPFPEEANRKLISQVASLHLAPTNSARDNLLREGNDSESIVVTGNTVIDALYMVSQMEPRFSDPRLQSVIHSGRRIVMVTTHRRENLNAMAGIGEALQRIARAFPDISIVFPAHLNPAVRTAIFPSIRNLDNVLLLDPLPYAEFVQLLNAATLVLTDSGGIQEEAPALGKPVLVMRDNTERPEAVRAGTVRLVGTDPHRIYNETVQLLENSVAYMVMSRAINPYGDGHAAHRVGAAVAQLLGVGARLEEYVTPV